MTDESPEAIQASHEAAQRERDAELIHARYIGTTPIGLPGLQGRERCCESDNQRPPGPMSDEEAEKLGVPAGVHREVLVLTGDVILLDRHSAEGREDFEVIAEHHASPKGKPSPKPKESE